jgi:hypothetical protein
MLKKLKNKLNLKHKVLKPNLKLEIADRRENNHHLDAVAVAKGLRRRKEDKLNDLFYFSIIGSIVLVLSIFFVGSFFVN